MRQYLTNFIGKIIPDHFLDGWKASLHTSPVYLKKQILPKEQLPIGTFLTTVRNHEPISKGINIELLIENAIQTGGFPETIRRTCKKCKLRYDDELSIEENQAILNALKTKTY